MTPRYPIESEDDYYDYRGEMQRSADELAAAVVGKKIVSAKWVHNSLHIELDTGEIVKLKETGDCCAYTGVEDVLLHIDKIDNMILGVGTTDGYETWHVFADLGDVLEFNVGWSAGSGYYTYGFDVVVEEIK